MAVLKQVEEKKIRMVKKETILPQDVWSMITSYAKFAGIKGQVVDKRNFIIEGALRELFKNDKEFQAYINKDEEPKEAAPVAQNNHPKNK